MDQQNQNPNPDYGFILNKPEPVVSKPKFSKKLIFGVAGVFVMLVIFAVAAALIPRSYSTQAGQTALSYFQLIDQKKYEAAYALLGDSAAAKKDLFLNRVAPTLQASYKLSGCASKGTVKNGANYTTTISCPLVASGSQQVFTIQTTRQNNTMKITDFTVQPEQAK